MEEKLITAKNEFSKTELNTIKRKANSHGLELRYHWKKKHYDSNHAYIYIKTEK